jgi:hypothetical protein
MKTYDLILNLLSETPELRSSDRKLLWAVWKHQGIANEHITYENFIQTATTAESITRARRKIQELHPELQANQTVRLARKQKAKSKGTYIFREETQSYYLQNDKEVHHA